MPTGAPRPGPGNPVAPRLSNLPAGHSGTLWLARRIEECRAHAIGTSVTCLRRSGNGSRAGPDARWIDANPRHYNLRRNSDRVRLSASAAMYRV